MSVTVKFRMLPDCRDLAPAKAHPDDAAYDLRSRVDAVLAPREEEQRRDGVLAIRILS